jgi:hypothetical protein
LSTTITIVSTLLGLCIKAFFELKKSQRRVLFLEEQSKINQLMRSCISKTHIDRFLILKLHNGANELINGVYKRYLATAINEEHRDIHVSVRELYQNIPVDDDYKKIVLKSYQKKFYEFVTDKEPPSDLKEIYEREGIQYALIYFIHSQGGILYFCSLSSYDSIEVTKEELHIIDNTIARIRESYIKYYT